MKTPTPGGPTAGWYDKVKNKIKSLRENNDTGPMMVATINGKTAEKAKVSVYAALSKQVLPNQVGMEFADED